MHVEYMNLIFGGRSQLAAACQKEAFGSGLRKRSPPLTHVTCARLVSSTRYGRLCA